MSYREMFDQAIGDTPPSGVDVDQVVARQRRARRVRPALTTVAVVSAVAMIPASTQLWPWRGDGVPAASGPLPVLECVITELPLPPHQPVTRGAYPEVLIADMDPTGRYVVGAGPAAADLVASSGEHGPPEVGLVSDQALAIVWDGGVPATIPKLSEITLPAGVNASGTVVGTGWDGNGGRAWVYRDGGVSELAVPAGYVQTAAADINASGDIVGEAWTSGNRHAIVVWPAAAPGQPQLFDDPVGKPVTPLHITDTGDVVGQFGDHGSVDGVRDPLGIYTWSSDGVGQELPLPPGAVEGVVSTVVDGGAEGVAWLPDPESADGRSAVAVRWDLTGRTVEVLPDAYRDAMVVRDGQPYDLPDPVEAGVIAVEPPAGDPHLAVAVYNDDATVIAGTVTMSDLVNGHVVAVRPVMWRCG